MSKAEYHPIYSSSILFNSSVTSVFSNNDSSSGSLFERRNGLNELAGILTVDNEVLYEKLVKDIGETGMKFQNWWDRMSSQYQWESTENGNWEIDFDTNEIYLIYE